MATVGYKGLNKNWMDLNFVSFCVFWSKNTPSVHFEAFLSNMRSFGGFINPLVPKHFLKINQKSKTKCDFKNAVKSVEMTLETPNSKQNVGNFLLYKKGPANHIKILNHY